MLLEFWKMNGAGNDFVVLDNRDLRYQLTQAQIAGLCDRHRGVGADGLLAVEPAQKGADYRMRYYNADGGEAEMCGNGARCFARFIKHLQNGEAKVVSFETIAGIIQAECVGDQVRIGLSDPFDLELGIKLEINGEKRTVHKVNTGVPHASVFLDDHSQFDVFTNGRAIRRHEYFAPKGTNANFVQVLGPSEISIRTYERGVEDETLACGTGMAACALIHHELTGDPAPVAVHVRGGDKLTVGFEKTAQGYRNVTLTGPADMVFQGRIDSI